MSSGATREATAAEVRVVDRAVRAPRRAAGVGAALFVALGVALGTAVAVDESVGLGLLFGAGVAALGLGFPVVLRAALRQQPTGRVERLAGGLTPAPNAEGTYGHLLGPSRVNVPAHWNAYLPEGQLVRAEGLRVGVPGRPPVYHLVTAESPVAERGPLSVDREVAAGLGGLYGSGGPALTVLGVPLLLAGLASAAVFSGLGARPAAPAWAAGWAAVAGAGLAAALAGAVPVLRLRARAWALYHRSGAGPPRVLDRRAWSVAAWGAVAMGVGLRLFGVPLWAGGLVGAAGFLPIGVLAALRPPAGPAP